MSLRRKILIAVGIAIAIVVSRHTGLVAKASRIIAIEILNTNPVKADIHTFASQNVKL